MKRETIIAILGGALSALLMASATPLVAGALTPLAMLPAYLSQLPLLAVGLGLGVSAAIKAGVAAAVASALAANVIYGLMFAALVAAPAVLLTGVLLTRRPAPDGLLAWAPLGHAAGVMCAFASGAIVFATVMTSGLEGGLFGQLERLAASIAAEFDAPLADNPTISGRELAEAFVGVAPFAPGIMGASWLFMLAANGALAQTILRRAGRNLRPSPKFTDFSVPGWLSIAWGVVTLAWIAFDGAAATLAANLVLVLSVPFFFAGLAVVHAWAARFGMARRGIKGVLLFGLYGSLVLIRTPIVLIVVAIGLIDDVADLRRRAGAHQSAVPARHPNDNDED